MSGRTAGVGWAGGRSVGVVFLHVDDFIFAGTETFYVNVIMKLCTRHKIMIKVFADRKQR